jgi:hypothetical protein
MLLEAAVLVALTPPPLKEPITPKPSLCEWLLVIRPDNICFIVDPLDRLNEQEAERVYREEHGFNEDLGEFE